MPRPKKKEEAGAQPKTRSRFGCWQCKGRKVKCGEEKPTCMNCVKTGDICDYSIRLNWTGRSRSSKETETKETEFTDTGFFTFVSAPGLTIEHQSATKAGASGGHDHIFSSQHIATAPTPQHTDLPTPEPIPYGGVVGPRLRPDSAQHTSLPSPRLIENSGFNWSPQHRAKRMRLSGSASAHPNIPQHSVPRDQSPSTTYFTPHSINSIVSTPTSSTNSGSPYLAQLAPPPDPRRLSVKYLLSDPTEDSEHTRIQRSEGQTYRLYGYDHGLDDLDIPHNDDNVILPRSPDLCRPSVAVSEASDSSTEGDARQIAFEPGGYYAQPVPIKIPRILEPLPTELLDNQMNLLYFHHFLNHTGRCMGPHDCPENPFRGVLPEMAMKSTHLLHLLLAFSASHRAKLLNHPEPAARIAGWMADVLPALRAALDEPSSPGAAADPTDPSVLAPLASAVMLCSLEIVTPNTFAIRIPWQQHLQVARRLIIARGGLNHLAYQKAEGGRDKAIFLLSRWFAYLDVLGSLSNRHEQPLFGAYLEDGGGLWLVNRDNDEIYQIDCFFGFSGRCIALLAQVAELSAQCDRERIDPITNQVKASWRPSPSQKLHAEDLKKRLNASASTVFRGCMHTGRKNVHSADTMESKDAEEIYATNEAYHWAGLIHLSRRVLALPSSHSEVRESVEKVLSSLSKVRRGSSAESCLLFPMFSAGCEAQLEGQRQLFMDRLKAVEGWGMGHVGRARQLMQMVWDTGRPWETLVDGEFFG